MTAPVAVVTGASSGIGRASAILLARRGFSVVLAARRSDLLEQVRQTIAAAGGVARAVHCDVRDEGSVRELFAAAVDEFGRVDLLFNNAGVIPPFLPIQDLSAQEWNEVVQTNLTGSFLCAREAFRVMKDQQPRGGRIINNGSVSAHVPRPHSVGYTATKHAITGLTRSLSLDGREFGIACGQIDVGNATDRADAGSPDAAATPGEGREPTMDVSHVAEAVAYMAGLPLEANVQFMTVMATTMPYIGRG
jgi:NAD(P)-dependent dehydrogenase (short-subunit alcohol dehydrogenase family)